MRNKLAILLMAGVLFAAGAALGQGAPAAGKLTFDVASVRPSPPMDQATLMASLNAGKLPQSMSIVGPRATFTYMSLKELVAYAYKVRPYQVSGPEWMVTDRFEIAAKLPDGATRDDVPGMLQALLIERFKLVTHLETKEHPVLALTVKGGPKLKEVATAPAPLDESAPLKQGETKVDSVDGPMLLSKNADGSTTYNMGARGSFTVRIDGQTGSMHMTASSVTMKGLAVMLTSMGGGVGRQIVDMTGLKGNYEVAVEFSLMDLVANLHDQGIEVPTGPSGGGGSDPNGNATIADALGKLGLKLEKSKAMVEQLMIDHVEKGATEN